MNKNNQSAKNEKAFTLIEILVAIAIVAILSTVVLVSLSSFRAKARAAKILAQLSSSIPSMIICWGNGGEVNQPDADGGEDICTLAASYGQWPALSGDLSSYEFDGDGSVSCGPTNCMGKSSWWVSATSSDDEKKICCHNAMNGCSGTVKAETETCDETWDD